MLKNKQNTILTEFNNELHKLPANYSKLDVKKYIKDCNIIVKSSLHKTDHFIIVPFYKHQSII